MPSTAQHSTDYKWTIYKQRRHVRVVDVIFITQLFIFIIFIYFIFARKQITSGCEHFAFNSDVIVRIMKLHSAGLNILQILPEATYGYEKITKHH